MTLYAVNGRTHAPVNIGDTVTNFRGETATLISLSRAQVPGKSGKVVVQWPMPSNPAFGATHYQMEYYDKVFDLAVYDSEYIDQPSYVDSNTPEGKALHNHFFG